MRILLILLIGLSLPCSGKPQEEFTAPGIAAEPVLTIHVMLGEKIDVGQSDDGHRYIVPITGGQFTGKIPQNGIALAGTVIDGGADWQVNRADQVKEIEAIYALRTDDGATIVVNNTGIVHHLSGQRYAITRPVLHAPTGRYDWLNKQFFIGTITSVSTPRSVIIRLFTVKDNGSRTGSDQ